MFHGILEVVMRQTFIIISVFVVVAILMFSTLWVKRSKTPRDGASVRIRGVIIPVEVRADALGRSEGLSGRASLGEETGMLFLFPQKDRYAFWMKDMQFALDFIWIGDGKVMEVTPSVPPQPPLRTFMPAIPVDTVLEVNAGFAARHGIHVGDTVDIRVDPAPFVH